jgi:DNA-binding NarL/FixJ family response regulator
MARISAPDTVVEAALRGEIAAAERMLVERGGTDPIPGAARLAAIGLVRLLGHGDVAAAVLLRDQAMADPDPGGDAGIALASMIAVVSRRRSDQILAAAMLASHDLPSAERLACIFEGDADRDSRLIRLSMRAHAYDGALDELLDAVADTLAPASRWVRHPETPSTSPIVSCLRLLSDGMAELRGGDWSRAASLAEECETRAEASDLRLVALKAVTLRAYAAVLEGRLEDGAELVRRAGDHPFAHRVPGIMIDLRDIDLHLALQRGDDERLVRAAAGIVSFRAADHTHPAIWLMDVAAARVHRVVSARGLVRRLGEARWEHSFADVDGSRFAGACAAAVSSTRDPVSRLTAVVDSDDGLRSPFESGRARMLLGDLLRRSGRSEEAEIAYAVAQADFDAAGTAGWRDAAEQRLAGDSPEPVVREADVVRVRLTPQERQIAELAAVGLSNKEIGRRLFLSPRTVGGHLYNVFPKLGITSRAALRDALVIIDAGGDDTALAS